MSLAVLPVEMCEPLRAKYGTDQAEDVRRIVAEKTALSRPPARRPDPAPAPAERRCRPALDRCGGLRGDGPGSNRRRRAGAGAGTRAGRRSGPCPPPGRLRAAEGSDPGPASGPAHRHRSCRAQDLHPAVLDPGPNQRKGWEFVAFPEREAVGVEELVMAGTVQLVAAGLPDQLAGQVRAVGGHRENLV